MSLQLNFKNVTIIIRKDVLLLRTSNVKGGKIMKLSKKWLSLLMAVALLASCASALADSKFVVTDGIAVKYVDTATDVVTADMFKDEGITAIGAS